MTLCDINSMICFNSIKDDNLEKYDHLFDSDRVCNCLQPCNSVEYKTELVIYRYNQQHIDDDARVSTIEFKHKHSEYFPYVRNQEFKTKDFLAYVGGLLGLFAGL
jgi:hypothetical protein